MQRVNFHRPPVVESSGLTFSRFLLVAAGSVLLAIGLLLLNLFDANRLQSQLELVEIEQEALQQQLEVLRARPMPVTDPALVADLSRMELRHDYWLSVLELLKSSDAVAMSKLDDTLIALDLADTEGVWLEQISINFRANPAANLTGRAVHSDASAEYLRRLEDRIATIGLTVTEMTVTAEESAPFTFNATLQLQERGR